MEIYPAVDLYEGKVVRLERGDYQKCKVYSTQPREIAKKWVEEGARWLHVIDLDGARDGQIKNWKAIEDILLEKKVSVQFGGGVRSENEIQRLFETGVKRVILGTKALDASFLEKITEKYGEKIALSFDLRDEEPQVEGWLKGSGRSVFDLFKELKRYSIGRFIITDIERDGTLKGLNLEKMERLLAQSPFPVIISGGVRSLNDLQKLIALGSGKLDGVIIGKALYEGNIKLVEALESTQAN